MEYNNKYQYKQQIETIDYRQNLLSFTLKLDEWSWIGTWVSGMKSERLSKEWFDDLYWLFIQPINGNYNEEIKAEIPRELLRMFVYPIGKIAYSLEVKPITAVIAQKILNKVNKQIETLLRSDDKWFEYNF